MSEHTPTPWHTGSTEHTELVMGFKENSECVLAELDTDDVSMEETAANAAFIVKAVNNHERMIEALKKAEELYLVGLLNAPDGLAQEVVNLRRAILTDLISPANT